jgi:ABC-type spermidine/putrescine transport system permease subunit II
MDSSVIVPIVVATIGTAGTVIVALINTRQSSNRSDGRPRISSVIIWGSIVPPIVFGLYVIAIGVHMVNGESRNSQSLGWLPLFMGAIALGMGYREFMKALKNLDPPTNSN